MYRAHQQHKLATDGLYGLVRHPQYTGLFIGLFGEGVVHWPTLISVILFPVIVIAYMLLAYREERHMLEQFGDQYRVYQRRVPMFFPVGIVGVSSSNAHILGLETPRAWRRTWKSGDMIRKLLDWTAGSAAVAASTAPALAQSGDQTSSYWRMHDGWGHMMGWGGSMLGGIGMLVFWGVVVAVLVLIALNFTGASRLPSGSTALEILKQRYAKGEINKEEYEQRKKTLAE